MNVFEKTVDYERRIDCLSQMLKKHIMDLKKRTNKLDDTYFCSLYMLTEYRINVLSKILEAIEKHDKVIVWFDMSKKENTRHLEFAISAVDKYSWEDLLKGLDSKDKGLCLSFCFDGDRANNPWYFATEDMLRGATLANVLHNE